MLFQIRHGRGCRRQQTLRRFEHVALGHFHEKQEAMTIVPQTDFVLTWVTSLE